MPVFVTFEGEGARRRLDQMVLNVTHHLPGQMQEEFTLWQSEDMNRKQPTVEVVTPQVFETIIRPRSLGRLVTSRQRSASRRAAKLTPRRSGRRPILRPELFQQLRERMQYLLALIGW